MSGAEFDPIGANGGDSREVNLEDAEAASGGGICIGNCGIETEILGAIDRVTLFVGGSITKLPASYDRLRPIAERSTGGRGPKAPSLVYDRIGD